jgi:hypothetical protein
LGFLNLVVIDFWWTQKVNSFLGEIYISWTLWSPWPISCTLSPPDIYQTIWLSDSRSLLS